MKHTLTSLRIEEIARNLRRLDDFVRNTNNSDSGFLRFLRTTFRAVRVELENIVNRLSTHINDYQRARRMQRRDEILSDLSQLENQVRRLVEEYLNNQ